MQAIWLMAANYNCRKRLKKLTIIKDAKTNSFCNWLGAYSIKLVPRIASGKKVKSKTSLLLSPVKTNTKIPKKAEIIIILKESCRTKGFTDRFIIAGNTKNKNQTAKIEKAMFSELSLK